MGILEEAMKPTPPAPLTGPELVKKYNEIAVGLGKPQVKKFRTLIDGQRRLNAIMNQVEPDGSPDEPMVIKKKAAKSGNKHKVTKKNGLDPDAMITILKKDAYNESSRKTKCGDHFRKMRAKSSVTVGEFIKSIGSPGDLRYWIEKGYIKVG